jgi:glucose/arabinose dehydrogenase
MKWSSWCPIVALVWASATLGCGGGGGSPPGTSDPPAGGGERITGSERLGWNQTAADAAELATLGFVAYVDNNRVVLTDVSCNPSGGGFQCSSRLPQMSPGAHTLHLASFTIATGSESSRSSAINVILSGVTAGADPVESEPRTHFQTTADGSRLRLDVVAEAIEAPTSLAFTRDGRAFVATRGGAIYVMSTNTSEVQTPRGAPAIRLDDVFMTSPDRGGLLDLALDPAFERTRHVYALYTTESRDGTPRFRVARFREAGGTMGERAVLIDDVEASPDRPAGAIGFGRDGKLYVAFDDGGVDDRPQASYSGKVLRLNGDGTSPDDRPSRNPVVAGDFRSPRGFDWHPTSGALWVVDARGPDQEELRVASTRIALPAGTDATSIAFYRGELIPNFQLNLLVTSGEGRHLLRLQLDRRASSRVLRSERLFEEAARTLSFVEVGPDGAVYLGTARAILRLGPA